MTIDEKTRLDLRQWFEREMKDPALANAMMEAMPPLDFDTFAKTNDVTNLGIELRGDMAELRSELRGDMAELRSELRGEMAELRGDIVALGGELRTEMAAGTRQLTMWMLATQLTTISVILAAMAFLHS